MIGNALVGVRTPPWIALCLGLLACGTAQAAPAADCPGHPDALGTARTLVVDPREHPRIGTMQYGETLPLGDHEVVLTFDDGPLPRYSNQVLQILADQCVKATFFTVGRQAEANPEGVRKLASAGHSIGTHSQNHPLGMKRISIERARQEIDEGIASVKSALGDDASLAPFFRIPGLSRAEAVEDYLAAQGIQTWSADFPADDWRRVSSSRVYELAMKRLEEKGKGILLLHDIQARTVAALPRILNELKARGYRIVHVVPATPEQPATPTEAQQWQLHPPSEAVAVAHWPKIPNFVFADAGTLPAPALSDLDWHDGQSMTLAESDRAKRPARGVPLPRQAPWPRQSPALLESAAIALPVPALSVFEIREGLRAAMQAITSSTRRAELKVPARDEANSSDASSSRRMLHGKPHPGRERQAAGRGTHHATHARRGMLKQLVQVRKRSV
jgi:peptidoglycan/xylan/chitin deacetylase (PgdA/CDA1 family)